MSSENISLNQKILKDIRITSQEQMLLNYMDQFYSKDINGNKLIEIINGSISIRLIDFFVTNYSKKNRVNYQILDDDEKKVSFNIYSSYKSQLKAWNKKYFDPFSRGDRIPFFFKDDCIITTIGQLNFFKWFISCRGINYVQKNYEKIETDMNKSKKYNTKNKSKRTKKLIKNSKTNVYKNYTAVPINCNENKKMTKIEVRFD